MQRQINALIFFLVFLVFLLLLFLFHIFFFSFQTTLRAKGVPPDVIAAALNKILKDSGDKAITDNMALLGKPKQS